MIRWITGKYGDFIPLAVLVLVLGGVHFVARGRASRPEQLYADARNEASNHAALIANQIGNAARITTTAIPPEWLTVTRSIRVADTEWRGDYAYPPLDLRGWRAEMIAIWVVGLVVALALSGVLLVLRRTVSRQRQEIARRQLAEESARTSASEARQRAREARELALQLEAATRASQRLSTSLNPDDVVELFLGNVAEILDADVASLYTFEEEGEVLIGRRRIVFREVGHATQRLKDEDIRNVRAKVEMLPAIAEAVATGEPHVKRGRPAGSGAFAVAGGSEAVPSTVTIPLLIAGHMVGVATWEVYGEPREFSPAVIAFAHALAAPAAAALRTAELFRSLEEERARARREALRFGAVLDQMADGVVIVDHTGKVERCNKAAEELLGSEIHGLMLEEWPSRFNLGTEDGRPLPPNEFPLLRALRGDRIRRGIFLVRSGRRTERHLACSAGPIVTARGEPAGAAMVMRDVSDEHQYAEMLRHTNHELRRQAEVLEEVNQQLREATKAKDQFLAVMSHELRTPINAIMGYSDLLDLGVKGELNPEQHAMIARVRETSRHLLGLINEVLDLAKIGSGRIDLMLVDVDVGAIVERAAQQILPMATAKGLRLETASRVPADATARAIADETRLAQIVINLLSNAVKFTSSGSVTVEYGVESEQVFIAVRDTGPGIAPEQIDRIFEEFYQIEGGLSRSTGGTGLGLAIARRFAHLMGGDITVRSEFGAGSEFVLLLPRSRRQSPTREGAAPIVVLAGSEELANRIVTSITDVRVSATTEPTRLLSLAHIELPDLIVLDLRAAAHGAWRTLMAIAANREIAQLPVLLLGRDRKSDEALDLGRVRVLARPFSAGQASAEITAAIAPENSAPVLISIDEPAIRADLTDALSSSGRAVLTAGKTHSALDVLTERRVSAVVAELMLEADGHALDLLAHIRGDAALRDLPVFLLVNPDLGPDQFGTLARAMDALVRDGRTRRLPIADLIRAAFDESAPVEAR